MDYLKEIKKEFPNIKKYENDDLEWENRAYASLKSGKYEEAKTLYKMICLSQPEHHDGFIGMAYIYYKEKNIEAAKWFISEGVKKAKEFLKDDSIDLEVVNKIIDLQKQINDGVETIKYWCFEK